MRESLKVSCVLVLMICGTASGLMWIEDRPTPTTWILRIVFPILALTAIGVFLALHFRRDRVPDYLYQVIGDYFNRDGFCFAAQAAAIDGVAYVEAWFQNQHDRQCFATIGLGPARNFFLDRNAIEPILCDINCEPGAFGVARIPFSLPKQFQGTLQSFEVGASVHYPHGKGQLLRFRDGVLIRQNSNFSSASHIALAVAGVATGTLALVTPAQTKLELPSGVAENIGYLKLQITTVWVLGDPPLKTELTTNKSLAY